MKTASHTKCQTKPAELGNALTVQVVDPWDGLWNEGTATLKAETDNAAARIGVGQRRDIVVSEGGGIANCLIPHGITGATDEVVLQSAIYLDVLVS